jgi:hypothetical protein
LERAFQPIAKERAFQPIAKVNKVTDANFILEKIENKLNGVMTVEVRFKIDLVCYLESLILQ